MIDYRELLKKYMNMIGEVEGTCFVGKTLDDFPVFTREEKEALFEIYKEL